MRLSTVPGKGLYGKVASPSPTRLTTSALSQPFSLTDSSPRDQVIDPPPRDPPSTDTTDRKTRFFAPFAIDSVRGVSDIGQIMEEVVSHLGEGVEISVEIQSASRDPAGYDERTRRTVTENARQLGASQQGFDD